MKNYPEIIINGCSVKLIPLGECACGCGQKTSIAKKTIGVYVKGKPKKYKSFSHYRKMVRATNWKGGRIINKSGYALLLMPDHNRADPNGYVREHLVIAEKAFGKPLPSNAIIHHVNEIKSDNETPWNLVVCESEAYHRLLHRCRKAYYACGNANLRQCRFCGQWDYKENLPIIYAKTRCHKKCKP